MNGMRVVHEILDEIQSHGLSPQLRPTEIEGIPDIPFDLTELDDDKLMELFLSFTEWTSYAQWMLASTVVQERGAEIELSRIKARVLAETPSAKTVTAQKNAASLHEDVISAEDQLYRVYCGRVLMEPILARAERNAAAMSRELSRRQGRASVDRRASKWSA